ncbi:Npl6p [Sugiyamaella lignohabitans]|uniref:Npl6p n=1 Tax=Sugiyamaella lignohabitans TaxID=796027 RepID=A0A167D9M1_9ASCO|nr:Npl6p [Sugiyamaella lignohabitans]ANB12650.1 Npl6p [Sugiyamaella lignohabitans]
MDVDDESRVSDRDGDDQDHVEEEEEEGDGDEDDGGSDGERDDEDEGEREGEGEGEGDGDGDEEEEEEGGEEETGENAANVEVESVPKKKGRGRPPGSSKKKRLLEGTPLGDDESGVDGVSEPGTPSKRGPGRGRGPGRKPKRFGGSSSNSSQSQMVDEDGNILTVENDEFVLEEDPEGEKKITPLGELQGGREFRVRTFTVEGRGDRLYMLSTEPARCMGFRDSYLLFQKHRKLYKLVISDHEKFQLIDRNLIPHSYKGRSIGLVTARSIFREFGARIIVGGRHVVDDYYEQAARDAGYVEGEIAEVPEDRTGVPDVYNRNQYSNMYHQTAGAFSGRDGVKDASLLHASKRRKVLVTDENWKLEHARSASAYNKSLIERRSPSWSVHGTYEPHTGISFYPKASQPTQAVWTRVPTRQSANSTTTKTVQSGNESSQVVIDTVMTMPNQAHRAGLVNVDPSIFETATPEIKLAILEQQAYERQWLNIVQ